MSFDSLYEALEKVIEDMALIEKEAMEINKEISGFQNQLQANSTTPEDSLKSTSSSSIAHKKSMIVGADDLLLEMKDKLTADARDLHTIPIVGMGGSGKTTLALNIYQDGLIEEHFYIHAWVTISQEYSIREILEQLITQLTSESKPNLSVGELGDMLYQHLCGRKYMIILDDMWSIKAWDEIKLFLPDTKNGSRIVITTRLITLASALPNSNSLGMELLDENDSWDLLSKTIFGEKGCPPRFEDIGKKIGKSCKGLPLSVVVVGGLLAKSDQSIKSWENMEKNLNAIVNLEDDERCLKTLYMSYKQLSIHLKPCFLYMGIYREDHKICISNLVKLWVAEGFIKPIGGKTQEDVARAYVKDLSDRNLILIHKLGSTGSIKKCKVHDLLRDLCLREAQKDGFYTVYPGHEIGDKVSRIVMSGALVSEIEKIDALSSVPLARYLILDLDDRKLTPLNLRLRIVDSSFLATKKLVDIMPQLINSRLLSLTLRGTELPSSICLFWNLQTLVVYQYIREMITVPVDIWYMPRIRHLFVENFHLPDPPPNVHANGIVLENLQSLGNVTNFTCSEQMVKRIPNVRKLQICYYEEEGVDERFCLTNLECLDKLESLTINFNQLKSLISYPRPLKKLALGAWRSQCWEDMLDKIGALPLLQKLTLNYGSFKGNWETTEGHFRSLKSFTLSRCDGLKVWTSEASHFPRLEQLHLIITNDLEEIPSDFAEISTLRLIDVGGCSNSVVVSAKEILEEQEELYGEEETTLQIYVELEEENDRDLKSLRSLNFYVTPYK